MTSETITYANTFGEKISPFLLALRRVGFFEPYIFMPVMTMAGIVLFIYLRRAVLANGTFDERTPKVRRQAFMFGYFSLCFLVTNAIAVALKTFIIQELDYTQWHWYIPYVAPLHVYISSVAATHIYLAWTNNSNPISRVLCAYVQIGLVGGFAIAIYRLLTEPFELTDVTTGVGSTFMLGWFAILNWDLVLRFFRPTHPKDTVNASMEAAHVN